MPPRSRPRHPMAALVVFLLFAVFGLFLASFGLREWWLQDRLLQRARPIDVVITKSEVFVSRSHDSDRRPLRSNSTTSYRPDIAFAYEVGGRRYESEHWRPTCIVTSFASREAAAAELAPYPVGARVKAFVADFAPERAFLHAEAGRGPLVFVIVGLLVVPLAWFGSRLI